MLVTAKGLLIGEKQDCRLKCGCKMFKALDEGSQPDFAPHIDRQTAS